MAPVLRRRGGGGIPGDRSWGRFWKTSYAPDWLGVIIVLVGYGLLALQRPFHRMFSLDDLRIQYPHALSERVPLPLLFVYSAGVPLVVITVLTFFRRNGDTSVSPWHHLHVSLLGLATALSFTWFVTDLIKFGVGRPRPDLLDRCKPKAGTAAHALVSWEVCTETSEHLLHDGWRSFPSGHSSFAWAGLGYLSLFLCGRFRALRRGADFATVLVCISPVLGAVTISISRTEDYRHDVYDVVTGSIIGASIALFSYRRYYPGPTTRVCHRPYLSRMESESEMELPVSAARGGNGTVGFEVLGGDEDLELDHVEYEV